MLSNIGFFLIIFTFITSISIIFKSFTNLKEKKNLVNKDIYQLSLYQTTFVILSFFTLLSGFVISDFSLVNVYENSHSDKPLFYKIAGTWGNHEGSLLLWINILVIFSYLFLIYNKKSPKNFRLYSLIFQNLLILGFLIFLFINSNPFVKIHPTPLEGLGLNPILQDPALAIHPPLLYVGFVGSSIYFSAALASLTSGYKGRSFATTIKTWVLISWAFQTLGIIAGSIWAYYELGWGGFWFWDPVENASLMPWFVITSLMHSIIVLEKRNLIYTWVIILCLLAFTLSVVGTFLVRSGVLNSVHTFANDPSRGIYILIFLSFMIFTSLIIFFKHIEKENYFINLKSKETFILINNYFMAFFLVTVLIGTLYPIFLEVLSNAKISVGPPFYNIIMIPVVVPFLIIMAIGPKISWIRNYYKNIKFASFALLFAILINFVIYYTFGNESVMSNLIIISSIFLIIYSLNDLIGLIIKKKYFDFSRVISHLGFGFLVFFIGVNHIYSVKEDFNLKIGEEKKLNNYKINFKSLQVKEEKNYKTIIGNFYIISSKDNSEKKLNPEIRVYDNPETLTYEASIKSTIFSDIYLTMSNISRSDYYNIKFQVKPFMIWIWLSAITISIGGFLRIFKKT